MHNGRRHSTCEAIVLRAYDVGEADRFCIVLTKEIGRLAVRASGARRLGSRLGSSLLPLCHVRLELSHHGDHPTVTASTLLTPSPIRSAHALAVAQEAVELLLRFTEDAQELPEIFDHCHAFLLDARGENALLPFSLRLLAMLGVLPLSMDDSRYGALSSDDRSALHTLLKNEDVDAAATAALQRFCDATLHEHLSRPLTSTAVRGFLTPLVPSIA